MTRTITHFTATVGAALLFAVPALGDNWGADQNQSSARVSPDLGEILNAKNGVVPYEALSRPVPILGAQFIEGAPSKPVATSKSTGSGIELEWSQLGIGFGVGIVLALGLVLGLRYVRIRPIAH